MHPEALIYFTSDHSLGSPGIYPYGLCIAVGIILCFGFLFYTMWKKKFNEASSDTILLIGIFATAFGFLVAALFQATYNYIENPAAGFDLGSGITFIGGLIGGVAGFLGVYFLYMYVVRPRTKIKFLTKPMNATLTDALPFIPIGICIAHAFGRLGCFFGGCCYGMETDAWYGIACAGGPEKVIPTQLFEMIFLLVLAAVMAFLYFKYRFNYNFSVYLIAYGIWRFLIEYLRDDARGSFIGSVTPSQFWSIIMIPLGVGYIFLQMYVLSKQMKHPELEGAEKAATEPDPQPEPPAEEA